MIFKKPKTSFLYIYMEASKDLWKHLSGFIWSFETRHGNPGCVPGAWLMSWVVRSSDDSLV